MSLALEFFGFAQSPMFGCPILRVLCEGWDTTVLPAKLFPAHSAFPTLRKEREGWGTRRFLVAERGKDRPWNAVQSGTPGRVRMRVDGSGARLLHGRRIIPGPIADDVSRVGRIAQLD